MKMNQMSENMEKSLAQQQDPQITVPRWAWWIVAITLVCVMVCHTYNDILITARQSLKVWDLLLEGRLLDFYKETEMVSGNRFYTAVQPACYPFPVYAIFALWNFPVWIAERLANRQLFENTLCLIWVKAMLIPCVACASALTAKVLKSCGKSKRIQHLGAFCFLSSSMVFLQVGVASQYDIITVCFILLGVDGWVQNKFSKFCGIFAVAICFKMFALLFFIPLLLLWEKRVFRLMLYAVLSIIPTAAVIFCFPAARSTVGSLTNGLLSYFTSYTRLGNLIIPPFLIIVISVCLYCYLKPCDQNAENRMQTGVFALMLIAGAFGFVTQATPYWVIMSVPFLIFAIFFSNNNEGKALLCVTLAFAGLAILQWIKFYWVYSVPNVGGMGLIPGLLNADILVGYYASVATPLTGLDIDVESIFSAVMLCAWGTLIYFCKPGQKRNDQLEPLSGGTLAFCTCLNLFIGVMPAVYAVIHIIRNY